ncbi:MAG: hypothetical protein J7L20_04550 [Thermoplasmata archaeon]|nr:hypothetical protein [Thermoplasmata archaeon]
MGKKNMKQGLSAKINAQALLEKELLKRAKKKGVWLHCPELINRTLDAH